MNKKYNRFQSGQGRQQRERFTERDMLQDMLITEKYLCEVLNHAILESSNDECRQLFQDLQDNAQGHAHMIYEEMSAQGWYNVQEMNQNQSENQSGRYRTSNQSNKQTGGNRYSKQNRSYQSEMQTGGNQMEALVRDQYSNRSGRGYRGQQNRGQQGRGQQGNTYEAPVRDVTLQSRWQTT